jgi:hypothetical protein
MKKQIPFITASLILLSTGVLSAQQATIFKTDRLGYTTTATRYNTLADLQTQTNPIDFVTIGNRDIRVYSVDETFNQIYGSFFYSTDPSGNRGVGNTSGNTGPGFMQIYDLDFSTVSSFDMNFGGWDGTYWTEARLQISGSDSDQAPTPSPARFSVYNNDNDIGIFHSYNLDLTVTGLEGFDIGGGYYAALNHPTGVTGTLKAVFQLTENNTGPQDQGFYDIEMTFNMDNWSWDNRDELTYPTTGFSDSLFVAPVPEPTTIGLLSILGMAGLLVLRRRLKK